MSWFFSKKGQRVKGRVLSWSFAPGEAYQHVAVHIFRGGGDHGVVSTTLYHLEVGQIIDLVWDDDERLNLLGSDLELLARKRFLDKLEAQNKIFLAQYGEEKGTVAIYDDMSGGCCNDWEFSHYEEWTVSKFANYFSKLGIGDLTHPTLGRLDREATTLSWLK